MVAKFGMEEYVVTDLGNGRCQLQWTMAMAPSGIGSFFMSMSKPAMGWFVQKMANNLGTYDAENVPQAVPAK